MQIREIDVPGYEKVVHAKDADSGLNAYIGVHDTTLGPALGGLRVWNYGSEGEALEDVLRLSRGMTYKSAIARTGLGGGKSVIYGDPKTVKTPLLLQTMGRFIDALEGQYITAEDVNIGIADLQEVRKTTRHVTGLSLAQGSSGNPSPLTAKGVYLGMRECLSRTFGNSSPQDRHFVVQGVGAVASGIIHSLIEDGAKVTACDINPEKIEKISTAHPQIEWVAPDDCYEVACDVFSPCALGAVLNDETIPRLSTKIIAGAANNQLAEVRHGENLRSLGILYAPDFVINAGGIINVSVELEEGGYNAERAMEKVATIPHALGDIFEESEERGISTNSAAIELAKKIVASGT